MAPPSSEGSRREGFTARPCRRLMERMTTPTPLEDLVRAFQKALCLLALRMLWNREAAENATLEILAGVVAGPPPLDSGGPVALWAYRAAARHLLNARESAIERQHLTFNRFAD